MKPLLNIIESDTPNSSGRGWIVHGLRLAIFCGIVCSIHFHARRTWGDRHRAPASNDILDEIKPLFASEADQVAFDPHTGLITALDSNQNIIASAVTTSPDSDGIIGFSGPSNVLIIFDADARLIKTRILDSQDTREHVSAVRDNTTFWEQFTGKSWTELSLMTKVDGVSGATLTSFAIGESIVHRLGGTVPNLRFPEPIAVAAVTPLFPEATKLIPVNGPVDAWSVIDSRDVHIGTVISTSPVADNITGYQGPTQTLIGVNPTGKVTRMHLHQSYDNEPYTTYPDEDWSFPELFTGLTLEEVAEFDLQANQVEGVSGATWTSMAMARAVIQTASVQVARSQETKSVTANTTRPLQFTWRDGITLALVSLGILIACTHLRGFTLLRTSYQIALIVVLGFMNGDLLSQALLVGWAEHGIPWQAAPRLALLTGAAFAFPALSKRNVYCSHLCAYGAAQQLLKNRIPWRLRLGKRLRSALSVIPAVLLTFVVVVTIVDLSFSLVDIEPFDGFLFWIAGPIALTIFLGGLLASSFIPMAYCRFGCPTGSLLEYLRLNRRSHQFGWGDALAIILLGFAMANI